MVEDELKAGHDRWAVYCVLMMQEQWKKEIEEAIEKVKTGCHSRWRLNRARNGSNGNGAE